MIEPGIVPPLKWAGGKRWLVGRGEFRPPNFNRLIEPFFGSGAVFFRLQPQCAVLSDVNRELIDFYLALRDEHEVVLKHLRRHARRHSKEYYYSMRESRPRSRSGAAARFLYLNRTCWNGLYRVNKRGEFNVPIGTKDNVILATDRFEALASALRRADIAACDFSDSVARAGVGDFVFADPPYTVAHKFNGFIKYNESIFSWEDQVRLKHSLVSASSRGAKFLVTNASHHSIRELYSDFKIEAVTRAGVIAGAATARGQYEELLISNYDEG